MRQEQQLLSKTTESTQNLLCKARRLLLKLVLGLAGGGLSQLQHKPAQHKKLLLLLEDQQTPSGCKPAKINMS